MKKYEATVHIMPLKELLDPQGKAVRLGLQKMGIAGVEDVRIGKRVVIHLNACSEEEAKGNIEEACQKLLANLIMESYEIDIKELSSV